MKKSKVSTTFANKVKNCLTVRWEELQTFEANQLKAAERRNVSKLKNAILSEGFAFPLAVWVPGDGTRPPYIIDGAGRVAALRVLEKDGVDIPPIPVVYIQAESREQALRLVTLASSQFGVVDKDSFAAFVQPIGGLEAMAPLISISSAVFATDYIGPVVGADEGEKTSRQTRAKTFHIPEFEPEDIFEFGSHQLMVGHDDFHVVSKLVKFIHKEWPEMPIIRNGEKIQRNSQEVVPENA